MRFLLLLLIISSCTYSKNKNVDKSLKLAGKNRSELIKVLDHYKNDLEKLSAAHFLIENMPHYYSYQGWQLDSVKKLKKNILTEGFSDVKSKIKKNLISLNSAKKVYDIHIITADYLIENIDLAFSVWKSRPWYKHYTFDDFCEYILPYRIGNEPLESWRKAYHEKYTPILDSLYNGNDVVTACNLIGKQLLKEGFLDNKDYSKYPLGALFLLKNRIGDCKDACDLTQYVMRSIGIPLATDFYIYSPEFENPHHWNVVKDTTGGIVPFWFTETSAQRGKSDGRKKGKVYRYYFSQQAEKYKGIYKNENLESTFKQPYIKDVTNEYFGKNELKIEVDNNNHLPFIYLGVFSINGWIPIDIALVSNGNAIFRNIEPNLIYQILYPTKNHTMEYGYPVLFNGNDYQHLTPDTTTRIKAALTRKYTLRKDIRDYMNHAKGAKIEGALQADFSDTEILHIINCNPITNYNIVNLLSKRKQRYIRYTSAETEHIMIAELSFYRDSACTDKIEMRVIKGADPRFTDPLFALKNINDNDPLSFFMSKDKPCSIIFDLGKATEIKKLMYIPRNDDNFIRIGDSYELFYQNGAKGWTSLGKQTAKENILYYNNLPQGALFWLRNLTRGKEEQIFRYENDQQIFPSMEYSK